MSGLSGDIPSGWFFGTLTAPGSRQLPWDRSKCLHGPDRECAGKIGCKVQRVPMAAWNGDAPRAWSDFITYLRRRLGVHVEYFACWEFQERGALHRHFMMRAPGISQRRMKSAIKWCATRQAIGFGRQVDVVGITGETASKVAGYCAKYTAKSCDEMPDHVMLDRCTGEMKPGGFRPWSASRNWGDSMSMVKACQRSYARGLSTGRNLLHDRDSPPGEPDGGGAALDPNSRISTQSDLEALIASIAEWNSQLL